MSIHEQKRWVVGAFALIALAMAVLLGIGVYRVSQRGVTAADTQSMETASSLKEVAAALKDPARREETVRRLREQKDVAALDLLAALGQKNKDPEVRAAALTALGGIVDPKDMRGVQVLTVGVRDAEPVARIAAIRSLGQVATDTAYVAVAGALADTDVAVRRAAAAVLSLGKGSSETVARLVTAFSEEEDVETRRLLALALGRLQDGGARRALLGVFGRDGESEALVRRAAVESLGAWSDTYAAQGLALGMCDGEDSVREQAKVLFVQLDASAITNLTAALESGVVRNALRGSRGNTTLEDMLDVLETLGGPEAAAPLVQILDIAVNTDEQLAHRSIRNRAVSQLASLGGPAIAPLAQAVLQSSARLRLKSAAAEALAGIGAEAVPVVEAYVSATKVLPSSEEVRIWAGMFERIGGEAAIAAAALTRSRDPVTVFRTLAQSVPPPSAERLPAPQLQEFSLVLYRGAYTGNPPYAFARRKNSLPFVKSRSQHRSPTAIQEYVPKGRAHVAMDLVRLKNGWDRVMCHPSCFNHIMFAKVDRLDVTDESIEGRIRAHMYRDPWVLGGAGEYTVSLQRLADGTYRGTYKGKYRDVPIEGIATCVEKPKRQPLRAGFRPVEPNERPRLLFRRDELPRLRARLNTPFGRAAFRRMATARYVRRHESAPYTHVALGVAYQLTGDRAYAMRAIPMVEREMQDRDFGFMGLGQVWGGRFGNIVLAYDLCYDAWPAPFRAKVNQYLVRGSCATATNMGQFSSSANTHPCSNYYSPIVGGGAMMALGYWMDPGSAPMPPGGTGLLKPAMLEGTPAAGAPVVSLRSGESPAQWLWAGPIYLPTTVDELVEAATRPDVPIREGTILDIAGSKFPFHPPPGDVRRGGDVYPWPRAKLEKPGCSCVGMVLHTVLQNARAGYYKVALPRQGSAHCLINGVRLPHGAYVELEAGLYPLLVAFTGDDSMVVPVGVRFRFITDSRKEVEILAAADASKAWGQKVVYDLDMAEHKATGMDGWKINVFNRTIQQMIRSHRLLMGTGGFQSEGEIYHHTAIDPIRYAGMCWNVFGQTLTPYPDVTHAVARYMGQCVFHESARKDRPPKLTAQSFNGSGSANHFAKWVPIGFPYAPDEYKPAMLWLWHRMAGVDDPNDPESYVNLIFGRGLGDAIYTFVNYPLDHRTGLCAIEPRHPNESFPKTWQATDKGFYAFRNQWKDKSDIVLQVYANELMSKGHGQPDAGGVRLHGLGYDWILNSPGKGTAFRWLQNVVVLPPDIGMKRAPGVVTSWQARKDGSGRVSIDMNLVYSGARGHDGMGIWPADPHEPGPVRGRRAVAADYSGKSGAPALFAFVDRIEGGPERFWLWNLPGRSDAAVKTGKNTFAIKQGEATLQATFVAPSDVEIRAPGTIHVRKLTKEDKKKRKADRKYKPEPTPVDVPIAAGAEAGSSYFVIMTLQEGPAPEVKVEKGEGLDAVVDVGGQKVRFDGENVLIGNGPKENNRQTR